MAALGPIRQLLWRSDLVANGGKAEIPSRARNDAIDPERTFQADQKASFRPPCFLCHQP